MNAYTSRIGLTLAAIAATSVLPSCGTMAKKAKPPVARTTITPAVEPRLDLQPASDSPAPADDRAAKDAREVAKVVEEHNTIREGEGRPPLKVDPKLTKAARRHAADMAANGEMSHKGSDGSSPFDRIEAAGYDSKRAAENVAAGEFGDKTPMDLWMGSSGHKKNILGDYEQIGVARATAKDGKVYWCVTFGTPPQS